MLIDTSQDTQSIGLRVVDDRDESFFKWALQSIAGRSARSVFERLCHIVYEGDCLTVLGVLKSTAGGAWVLSAEALIGGGRENLLEYIRMLKDEAQLISCPTCGR